MTGKTHLIIGIMAGSVLAVLSRSTPVDGLVLIGAAGVGSLFPDIDSPNSTISNKARPLRLLTFWIPHRTLTHSIFAVLLSSLLLAFGLIGLSFVVGYASHIMADMLTTKGIPLFYPFWYRSLHLLPYPFRIVTGGLMESLFSVILLVGSFLLMLQFFGIDVLSILRTL